MAIGLLVRGAGLAAKGIGKALKSSAKRQKKTLKKIAKDVKKNPRTTAKEAGLVAGTMLTGVGAGTAAIPKKKRKEIQKTLSQSFVRASEKTDKRGKNPAGSSIKEMNKR